jgi:hypothetical protein
MFETKPVEPTGQRTSRALVRPASGPCEFCDVTEPTYPENARARLLRHSRVTSGWTLRELANAVGMKAADLSAVECGSAVFVDDGDWERLIELLEESDTETGKE